MAYRKELTSGLPRVMAILWFLNIAFIAGNTVLQKSIAPFGLAGNANWNAALLIITTIWSLYLLSTAKWEGTFAKAYFFFICGLLLITGGWSFLRCNSRAALLALCAAGLLAAYLEYGYKYRKACLTALLAGITGLAVFATIPAGNRILTERIAEDVRIPLWEGCIKLIGDNWMTGTAPSLFESEFAPYVPEDYFMRDNAAVRCNHPHNHFLFFAAAFGMLLFPLWAFLLLCPLFVFFRTYREKNTLDKLIFYSFLILLIHSMLDLVLYEWPTNVIGLMLLGLLWGMTIKTDEKITDMEPGRMLRHAGAVLGVIFAFYLIIELKNDFMASANYRNALIFSKAPQGGQSAAFYFDKALDYKGSSPKILYKAAMNAFHKLNNPDMALSYLRRISADSPARNYAHGNGFIGLILCRKGQLKEGLKYLDAESENYPLSTTVRYYQFAAHQQLGEKAAAEDAYAKMLGTLKLKGLSLRDLPEVLENPDYDSHPRKLLEKRAENGTKE